MTNISKKDLKEEVSNKIFSQFTAFISDLNKSSKAVLFVEEFFSESERIMFSKRLAIIFMLLEDAPFGFISRVLKVSPTTVNKIALELDGNGFETIKNYFNIKKNKEKFWSDLETILRAGLPPRGRGRWKKFYEIAEKKRKK